MPDKPKKKSKIFISTGEASGDLLGANLIDAIQTINPNVEISGMGSHQMLATNVNIIQRSEALSVIGIFEVFTHLKPILFALSRVKKFLKTERPDLLILIDFPGFNFKIAHYAKKLGIKIFYYVSPQVWAWHKSRIHTLKKLVDHMAVLFPFEEKLYQAANIPATFVGHPITKLTKVTADKNSICTTLGLDPNKPIVGLMPGSRTQEIQRLLPIMVSATELIKRQLPNVQFVLPIASSLTPELIQPYLNLNITAIEHQTYNVISICDSIMITSGTATLEVALLSVPMVIVYKMNALTCWLARRFIKLPNFGLCNIVAEKNIAKELLQEKVTPTALSQETLTLLSDTEKRTTIINDMQILHQRLGNNDASHGAASLAIELL